MASAGPSQRDAIRRSAARRRLLQFELLGQRRVLASLTGQVFHDLDDSFHKNGDEVGLAQRVVYIDLDGDAQVDLGEPLQLTDDAGRFAFEGLAPGDYAVRLFNGTDSQTQNTPFLAEQLESEIALADPFADGSAERVAVAGDERLVSYSASGDELVEIDLQTEASRTLTLDAEIVDFHSLGNGDHLVLLAPSDQNAHPAVVLVSFSDGSVTPLGGPQAPAASPYASDLAINAAGRGLMVPAAEAGQSVPLQIVSYDGPDADWSVEVSTLHVDAAARVWADGESPLILVSQPAGSDTQLALWSTTTGSVLPGSDLVVEGITEVLGFSADAGLVIARHADGGVRALDVDNQFDVLHSLPEMQGPITFDGHRELLFGMFDDTTLGIFDIRQGEMRVTLALTTAPGAVAALALSDRGDRLTLRRRESLSQVRIDLPDAHHVSFEDEAASKDVLFGMLIDSENETPAFPEPPQLEILEDTPLSLSAPGLAAGVPNPEGDSYLTVQISDAQHGTATVRPDGSLSYVPDANFFGTDTFEILVTDGRDDTGVVTVTVDVLPVDDLLQGFEIDIPSFPENVLELTPIGTIELDEVDGDPYVIQIDDPRFFVDQEEVFVAEGAEFDYETEPSLLISIEISDPENPLDSTITMATLLLEDTDDPPTGISPETAEVAENSPGLAITEMTIEDQDATGGYTLETPDTRFRFEGTMLMLREGEVLDHETTPLVAVPIVIRDSQGNILLEEQIDVTVNDSNDAPSDILLSGQTVREMVSGASVGTISVVDQDGGQSHQLSVDDSRFEIVGATLKLRDGVFVRREEQAEIQITITASDGEAAPISRDFLLSVQENTSPWTNPLNPTDVDGSGETSPIDALIIINTLNNEGPHDLDDPFPSDSEGPRYYDVNGDGQISPIDALIIINELNRDDPLAEPGSTNDEGEGESDAPLQPVAPPLPQSPSIGFGTDEDEDRPG